MPTPTMPTIKQGAMAICVALAVFIPLSLFVFVLINLRWGSFISDEKISIINWGLICMYVYCCGMITGRTIGGAKKVLGHSSRIVAGFILVLMGVGFGFWVYGWIGGIVGIAVGLVMERGLYRQLERCTVPLVKKLEKY